MAAEKERFRHQGQGPSLHGRSWPLLCVGRAGVNRCSLGLPSFPIRRCVSALTELCAAEREDIVYAAH